jgi:predicted aldo/keto reductase-like oxidoreductase
LNQIHQTSSFLKRSAQAFGREVCRLGLASRGRCGLTPDDVLEAIQRGVNFLNWPGESEESPGVDAFSQAVGSLGSARDSVVVCTQLGARSATEAQRELNSVLATLKTDYLDVVTLYYVEQADEWESLLTPDSALAYCQAAKADGLIRRIGLTSHQRPLAAVAARSGLLDLLMIRYNAAHRGAETEVFPITDAVGMPVIAYTALRWGALLGSTPDDPPKFEVPRAAAWYRFVLQSPSVAVVLAAPSNRRELIEDLNVLDARGPLDPATFEELAAHGQRVHRHACHFP